MKRIKIWLKNFTLLQQFLTIVFLTISILAFFILAFLSRNIDRFVDNQMFVYVHRAQDEFISTRISNETNVIQYVYNVKNKQYLNKIDEEYKPIILHINPDPIGGKIDSSFSIGNNRIVYSVISFDKDYRLVSIIKNDFRTEFRDALLNGVVDVTFYVICGLICLILLWVVSLIRPLNEIKNYINKLRAGENSSLNISRNDEIGEVAEALTSMNQELSEQKHIRDEMIQNISHDLKTPIATIKSYSESIKDGIYPYDTLEKSVDVISENANRLEKKVYSLITYNKLGYLVDSGDDILNLEMNHIIKKAILDCEAIRGDVKIHSFLDKDVYFHGDEEPWRVVIENLLDNALRYAKANIRVILQKDLLEVYNDGETMDIDRIDKLFKAYEKGTKGKFGLGLSIVKKVTETYGYNVTGENMSDGVVFRVYAAKKFKKQPKKKSKKV